MFPSSIVLWESVLNANVVDKQHVVTVLLEYFDILF